MGLLVFQISGCGKKSEGTPVGGEGYSPSAPAGQSPFNNPPAFTISEISYDSSVKSDYQELIKKDLSLIARSNFESDSEAQTITGMASYTNRSMADWLTARVRYVLGESYSLYTGLNTAKSSITYSPLVYSDIMTGLEASVTVMSNLGSAVYSAGKKSSTVYSLRINGIDIEAKSARVGIIQIGAGLFDEERFSLNSTAASIARLGTFFHEARHSDGNGESLGFSHAKCVSGTFAGEYACENFTNGPYMVQSVMLKKFYNLCGDCSSTDKTKLQALIADRRERLMTGAKTGDPRPEKIQ